MPTSQYAEIVAECALHQPAKVREWIGPDGVTHPAEGGHPVAFLSLQATQGWQLVTVTTGNLRIYTLRRDIHEDRPTATAPR